MTGLGQNWTSTGALGTRLNWLSSPCLASTISCNNPHALWRKTHSKIPFHTPALGPLTLGQLTTTSQLPSALLLSTNMMPLDSVACLPPRKLLGYMTTLLAPLRSNLTPITCKQLLRIHWTLRNYLWMVKSNFPRNPRLLPGTLRSGRT